MEKTTSVINLMPSNIAQVVDFVQQTKDIILSGNENPLKIAVQLKGLEEVVKKLRTDNEIQEYTLDEALKEKEKTFKLFGAEITVREMGVKYDYSDCNDSELIKKYAELEELKESIKRRENMLKNISDKNDIISEKGEIFNPPLKTSKTGISITLK